MPLHVWTSSLRCSDPDVLNITRKSGDPVFAPSWKILGPAIQRRKSGLVLSDEAWKAAYALPYLKEMAGSYRKHFEAWQALLARRRVVLTCYCPAPERCHRTLLGHVLAERGAIFHGELPPPQLSFGFDLVMELGSDDD